MDATKSTESESRRAYIFSEKVRGYEDFRRVLQAMCDALESNLITKTKTSSNTANESDTKYQWTKEDLKRAGVPEQHIDYTIKMILRERQYPSPYAPWQDMVEGEIAWWATNPKIALLDVERLFNKTWWEDMFQWTFGRTLKHARDGYREYIDRTYSF